MALEEDKRKQEEACEEEASILVGRQRTISEYASILAHIYIYIHICIYIHIINYHEYIIVS